MTWLILLALAWVVMAVLVDPRGDFPLNDDWAHGYVVKTLLDEGVIRLLDWTPMTLVAQVLWGAAFSIFGFSYTALRISTLVAGLGGVVATYALVRACTDDERLARLGAVLIALNPLYVSLSFTFMADVPFTAASVAAMAFLVRHLKRGDLRWLIAAGVALAVATLIRQLALVIAIAYAMILVSGIDGRKRRWGLAAGFLISQLTVYAAYNAVMSSTVGLPATQQALSGELIGAFTNHPHLILARLLSVGLVGHWLFGLTFAPAVVALPRPRGTKRLGALCLALSLVVLAYLAVSGRWFPVVGNVMHTGGIGPELLRDVFVSKLENTPTFPLALRVSLGLVAVGCGGWVVAHVIGALGEALRGLVDALRAAPRAASPPDDAPRTTVLAFLWLACFGYATAIAIHSYFDRYFIFFAAPAFCLVAMRTTGPVLRPSRRPAVVLAVGLLAWMSIAGAHDYMAWNRARWQALRHLTEDLGVSVENIDGGFEFNARYLYDPSHDVDDREREQSWYWVKDDTYLVTFGQVPDYHPIERYPYHRWLYLRRDEILLQRRGAPAAP